MYCQCRGIWYLVKGFIHKWVIIMLTQYIGHDTPVTEVKDGAEIELMYRNPHTI